nr:hypothetical protein [Luteimonas padinae]
MTLPSVYGPAEVTDLVISMPGSCAIGVSTSPGGVVIGGGVGLLGVEGGVPPAVALLCTLPAFTSAAVTV